MIILWMCFGIRNLSSQHRYIVWDSAGNYMTEVHDSNALISTIRASISTRFQVLLNPKDTVNYRQIILKSFDLMEFLIDSISKGKSSDSLLHVTPNFDYIPDRKMV